MKPQAQVKRGRAVGAEYNLDVLGEKPLLSLPTLGRGGRSGTDGSPDDGADPGLGKARSGVSRGGGGGEISEDMRAKLATVLAKEFARKVRCR